MLFYIFDYHFLPCEKPTVASHPSSFNLLPFTYKAQCYLSVAIIKLLLLRRVYGYHFCRNTNSNELSGTSFVTTAFAPMVTLFPIVMPPIIFAPLDNMTLLPIRGMPDVPTPIITPWNIRQFIPIIVASFITIQEKC